jgi:hypothetical protein
MVHMRAEYINGEFDRYYGIHNNLLMDSILVT